MQKLEEIIRVADEWIWGLPLVFTLCFVGVFYTVRLRGIQVRLLPRALKLLFASEQGEGEVSRFAALSTSLAAMIGTGNIVGVATAVGLGGPGALFWMWVSAFFGMATGYAEGLLSAKYRKKTRDGHTLGGAFFYIERGMGARFRPLAVVFAICGMVAAIFGIGTVTQINGITQATKTLLGKPDSAALTVLVALLVTLLAGKIIYGGIGRVSKVSAFLVPVMGTLFALATIAVLLTHVDQIPNAICEIVSTAFCGRAMFGGWSGSLVMKAIRMGVSRGVFSNEAGLGSASIAAASAKSNHPAEQGLVTMTGTFLDTLVLCTLTGLAIVVTGAHQVLPSGGVELTALAYDQGISVLPGLGQSVVDLSLILFAFASVLGWNFYGEKCAEYLGGEKLVFFYRAAFCTVLFCGAFFSAEFVWDLADCCNGLMAIPNLVALMALSPVVVRETKDYEKFWRKKGF